MFEEMVVKSLFDRFARNSAAFGQPKFRVRHRAAMDSMDSLDAKLPVSPAASPVSPVSPNVVRPQDPWSREAYQSTYRLAYNHDHSESLHVERARLNLDSILF